MVAIPPSPAPPTPEPGVGWAFHALGLPAPQGSKAAKGRTSTGRIILAEASKRVAPWRATVTAAAVGAGPCLDGPLAVAMVLTVPRPRSARKADRIPPRTPDLSKLARAVEDAVTDAGLWVDDARVAMYQPLAKVYVGCPYPGVPAELVLPVPGVLVAAVVMDSTGTCDQRDVLAHLIVEEGRRAHERSERWRAESA